MPPPASNFLRTGRPDARLAQTAGVPFDATARQVLDQQVVDQQVLLAQLLINGIIGSYVQIDPGSPVDVTKGDVLCRSAVLVRNSALVATPVNLAAAGGTVLGVALDSVAKGDVLCRSGVLSKNSALVASTVNLTQAGGSVLGVALDAVTKGSRCPYAALGAVPPEVTGVIPGLGSPRLARVSSAGRAELVTAYGEGDVPLGGVDASGWLALSPGGISPSLTTGIFRGAITTTDATPTTLLSVPFADNGLITCALSILAVTPPFGTSYLQTARFGVTLAVVGGVLQAPIGTPVEVTSNTYPGPDFPSFAPAYSSNTLSIVATGIAATQVRWVGRLDALTILSD